LQQSVTRKLALRARFPQRDGCRCFELGARADDRRLAAEDGQHLLERPDDLDAARCTGVKTPMRAPAACRRRSTVPVSPCGLK
jgi:hypothetical protein